MGRERIAKGGHPYLDRLRLLRTPWFGVYLHRIHIPDLDRDPHDHPWWFASIVLSGGYTETVWDSLRQRQEPLCETRERVRGRLSLRSLNRTQAHRITEVRGVLRTLVVTGPRRSGWGFWTDQGFVAWRDYLKDGIEEAALWGGPQ
jgi:hypothetical protein